MSLNGFSTRVGLLAWLCGEPGPHQGVINSRGGSYGCSTVWLGPSAVTAVALGLAAVEHA